MRVGGKLFSLIECYKCGECTEEETTNYSTNGKLMGELANVVGREHPWVANALRVEHGWSLNGSLTISSPVDF